MNGGDLLYIARWFLHTGYEAKLFTSLGKGEKRLLSPPLPENMLQELLKGMPTMLAFLYKNGSEYNICELLRSWTVIVCCRVY